MSHFDEQVCPGACVRRRMPIRALATDDRGAIMVMGIPVCIFLVGALWYIAGVGDAHLFRERMQEGADAVAFSTAVVNARGMNVIVLLNLLMAAILAIRVAINLIKYTLIVLAGVFDILKDIPWPPTAAIFLTLEGLAEAGAQTMASADNVTRQPIDEALILLNKAETFVAEGTPLGALGAAQLIAHKYEPTVRLPAVAVGSTIVGGKGSSTWGLPVEKDTNDKLCEEAFKGVGGLIDSIAPGGGRIIGMLHGLISGIGASDVFCELNGGGGNKPDLSKAVTNLGNDQCTDAKNTACSAADAAETALETGMNDAHYDADGNPGPDTTAQDVAHVAQLTVTRDAAKAKCDGLQNCQDNVQNNQGKGIAKAQAKADSVGKGPPNVQGDKRPSKVKDGWHNGIVDAQIGSLVYSDKERSGNLYSAKFVKIGSRGFVPMDDPGFYQLISWAQAEFFYDCLGKWTANDCNGSDDAMWNFRWRARFRLFNPDAFSGGSVISLYEMGLKAKIAIDGVSQISNINLTNFQAKAELEKSVAGYPLTLH